LKKKSNTEKGHSVAPWKERSAEYPGEQDVNDDASERGGDGEEPKKDHGPDVVVGQDVFALTPEPVDPLGHEGEANNRTGHALQRESQKKKKEMRRGEGIWCGGNKRERETHDAAFQSA